MPNITKNHGITYTNSHFSKFHYIHLPSCITSKPIPLFTLVTQLLKSVEKNLAYYGLLNFWNKHFMPPHAMQNGILSLIQALNKPNCLQEALILYLVSENELSKPNQFRFLEVHRFLP